MKNSVLKRHAKAVHNNFLKQQYKIRRIFELDYPISHYIKYLLFDRLKYFYNDYPIDVNGKSMIRKQIFGNRTKDSYFLNLYKARSYRRDKQLVFLSVINKLKTYTSFIDLDKSTYTLLKTELLKGEFVDRSIVIEKESLDIVAISPVNRSVDIEFDYINTNKSICKKKVPVNQFTYFNLQGNHRINIKSKDPFFISHFKNQFDSNKPKLVLTIFIDGLSNNYLLNHGLEKVMPNTYNYFKDGFIANQCFSTGEWTLPSVASIFTGKYTINHELFHPHKNFEFELKSKLLQEFFYDDGYMTSIINNDWRFTPSHGYYKKMNRSIYCPMMDRMQCDEMICEALEHLEVFKSFNNFLWVSLMDLHCSADFQATNPMITKMYEDDVVSDINESSLKSPHALLDKSKIINYHAQIKKVDFYLGILYAYLMKNYKEHDIIVTLLSDHGQSFLSDNNKLLNEQRVNVPFFAKGKNIPSVTSDELISNIDILPSILQTCNISLDTDVDGQIFAAFGGNSRDYVFSESIYPGQTYKASIRDSTHVYDFESEAVVGENLQIDISRYNVSLCNRITLNDESGLFVEKLEMYYNVVLKHLHQN